MVDVPTRSVPSLLQRIQAVLLEPRAASTMRRGDVNGSRCSADHADYPCRMHVPTRRKSYGVFCIDESSCEIGP